MSYLADLAEAQDSADRENTDVHGICEIGQPESSFWPFRKRRRPIPLSRRQTALKVWASSVL
jgi:hypothetical protein